MKKHELWWADLPEPIGRRPVLLLSRNHAYRILKRVTVAEIGTTTRNIPVEIELGRDEGLSRASVANMDNLHAVAISRLSSKVGELSGERALKVERPRLRLRHRSPEGALTNRRAGLVQEGSLR